MSKFEIGEVAIFASGMFVGEECTIEVVEYVTSRKEKKDYAVSCAHPSPTENRLWGCLEPSLRKKKPPEEISSWERVEKECGWNPIKETVT